MSGGSCPAVDRLFVFSAFWAVADVLHLLVFSKAALALPDMAGALWWVHLATALWLILRPSSVRRLAALLVAQVVGAGSHFPVLANHMVFLMVVNATVLVSLASSWWGHRGHAQGGASLNREALYDGFAPVVRLELVLLYLLATLHKLNWGFLDPAVSCATEVLRRMPTLGLGSNPWLRGALIAATLGTELGVGLLLASRRGRRLGVGLALLFHGLFFFGGSPGVASFSVLIFAYLLLFADAEVARLLGGLRQDQRAKLRRLWPLGVAIVAGLIVRHVARFGHLSPMSLGPFSDTLALAVIMAALGLATAILLSVALWRSAKQDATSVTPSSLRAPAWSSCPKVLWLGPTMVLLAGVTPYLGFRTVPAFSMFSNLRTDDAGANHIFLPRMKLVAWEDDTVLVIATDHAPWQVDLDRYWPRMELWRRVAHADGDLTVTYSDRGVTHRLVRRRDVTEDNGKPVGHRSYWAHKLVRFRTVPRTAEADRCRW